MLGYNPCLLRDFLHHELLTFLGVIFLTFDVAQVIQLQGDQRKNVSTFLVQVCH